MSGQEQQVSNLLKESVNNLQKAIELQQPLPMKERRCGKCNRLLCKSSGKTEVKCKCGRLNLFTE